MCRGGGGAKLMSIIAVDPLLWEQLYFRGNIFQLFYCHLFCFVRFVEYFV